MTGSIGDGTHELIVRATDAAGNVGADASLTITIDTVKPAAPTGLIKALPVKAAVLHGTNVPNAMNESVWTEAPMWRIKVPAAWRERDTLLRIHYVGDVARLYAGGKLVADKFYKGQPFDVALWRISHEQFDTLELRVMR